MNTAERAVGLEEYVVVRQFVPFGPNPDSKGIMVRGLNTDDIAPLLADHMGGLVTAVELYQQVGKEIFHNNTSDKFMALLLRAAPEVTSKVIALACDQPELYEQAGKLAWGVQMRALSEIIRLTLEDAGGIKNLFAALASALPGVLPQKLGKATDQPSTKS